MTEANLQFLLDLEAIVEERLQSQTDTSYTVKLANSGSKRLAQKIGEEGVELALAAATNDKQEIVDEAADLIYHLIVLLATEDLSLSDVAARLETRHQG